MCFGWLNSALAVTILVLGDAMSRLTLRFPSGKKRASFKEIAKASCTRRDLEIEFTTELLRCVWRNELGASFEISALGKISAPVLARTAVASLQPAMGASRPSEILSDSEECPKLREWLVAKDHEDFVPGFWVTYVNPLSISLEQFRDFLKRRGDKTLTINSAPQRRARARDFLGRLIAQADRQLKIRGGNASFPEILDLAIQLDNGKLGIRLDSGRIHWTDPDTNEEHSPLIDSAKKRLAKDRQDRR